VITVVDSIAVPIVSMIFFLTSVVLWPRRGIHCGWRSKSGSKNKRTEKILVSSVHFFILLAQEFDGGVRGHKQYVGIAPAALFNTTHF
jgi:hypothetical protein